MRFPLEIVLVLGYDSPMDCRICYGAGRILTARRSMSRCPNGCEVPERRTVSGRPIFGPPMPDSLLEKRTEDEIFLLLRDAGWGKVWA